MPYPDLPPLNDTEGLALSGAIYDPNTGELDISCYWCRHWRAQGKLKVLENILIDIRNELRSSEQWEFADRIRNKLNELGIAVKDEKLVK